MFDDCKSKLRLRLKLAKWLTYLTPEKLKISVISSYIYIYICIRGNYTDYNPNSFRRHIGNIVILLSKITLKFR
jgi:hypothetical protein